MKILIFYITISCFGLFFSELVCAQNVDKQINERIIIFSDRNLFIVGEYINFVGCLLPTINFSGGSLNNREVNLSSISYIEIVTPDGFKVAESKCLISNYKFFGSLKIPSDAYSGNYFIRAYTRRMRNFGPYSYSYLPITIVNPFKPEVLIPSAILNDTLLNYKYKSAIDSNTVTITADKINYKRREKVSVAIRFENDIFHKIINMNISVVPKYTIKPYITSFSKFIESKNSSYHNESQGPVISGKLLDNQSNRPIPSASVFLSLIGDEKDILETYTDSEGQFHFLLPYLFDSKDLFISTNEKSTQDPLFLIDNNFCNDPFNLTNNQFKLLKEESEIALKLAKNCQVNNYFNNKIEVEKTSIKVKPFYGDAPITIYFDQYILLPTLEDYINELLPLKVINYNGKRTFKIINSSTESLYDPLVLLDFIPIYDINKVLKLSPEKLDKIELINEPYIKGSIIYKGIVSIISKKNDYAGVELPSSGVFLNVKFLTYPVMQEPNNLVDVKKPDSRNTIFWGPNITIEKKEVQNYSFYTADTFGNYIIVIRGVLENGDVFIAKKEFSVK